MTFLVIDEFHTPHWSLAPFTVVSKGGGRGGVRVKLSAPPQGLEFFYFFYFFKFYVLMQPKAMKHDAIYLNSSTEALCVC